MLSTGISLLKIMKNNLIDNRQIREFISSTFRDMHTDSVTTDISLSDFMLYMTVASLEMSDEPSFLLQSCYFSSSCFK